MHKINEKLEKTHEYVKEIVKQRKDLFEAILTDTKVWKITLVKDNVKILLVFLPEWDWFGLVISVDLVIADVKTTSHSYRTSKGKAINYIKILEGKGWKKVEEK